MRVLMVLPGLHKFHRGAEVAFMALANSLVKRGDEVTVFGSGPSMEDATYSYRQIKCVPRTYFEKFPKLPIFRHEYAYEELTFVPGLIAAYNRRDFDLTVTCSYPFVNWILQRRDSSGPPHIFVTENGDWPAQSNKQEYKFFGCDGLICTNPSFFERNCARWNCALIPNGVNSEKFYPGVADRSRFGLPASLPIILMVSALDANKRVDVGVRAVSALKNAYLVVAGDGPLRDLIDSMGASLLPGRFKRLKLAADEMPELYRSVDVFMHLALEESFGNVYLEAMSAGLEIVSHDTPTVRWIVGDGCNLVDTNDMPALVSALEVSVEKKGVRNLESTARAKTFDWDRIAELYQDFMNVVVQSGAKSRLRTGSHD